MSTPARTGTCDRCGGGLYEDQPHDCGGSIVTGMTDVGVCGSPYMGVESGGPYGQATAMPLSKCILVPGHAGAHFNGGAYWAQPAKAAPQADALVAPYGWVQAVPMPYLGVRGGARCSCGRRFKGRLGGDRYRAHWLLEHSQLPEQLRWHQRKQVNDINVPTTLWAEERLVRELARLAAVLREAASV